MQYVTDIVQAASRLLFCGFMAFFIIPKLFFWIFYTIPQIIRFSVKKIIKSSAMIPIVNSVIVWILLICSLYIIAYSIDADTGYALLASVTAIVSWCLAAINIAWTAVIAREKIQDEFYNNVFLTYIVDEEKLKYDNYIEKVGKLTYEQAMDEQKKKLSYLHKKAVGNRIRFLLANDE